MLASHWNENKTNLRSKLPLTPFVSWPLLSSGNQLSFDECAGDSEKKKKKVSINC